jgi:hypothetical protein
VSAHPFAVYPNHTRVSPVFVLGHARSGTSLMCRLLLDHLGVNFGTESQFIVRYQQKLARYGDLGDDRRLRWLIEDISRERFFARTRQNFGFVFDVEQAVRSIGSRTYSGVLRGIFEQFAASQGLVRWGDKTPDYCRHLPLIHQLFPDAQFLHVIRDGRDVAHSIFKTGFGPKNAYEAALDWKRTVAEIRRFREMVPEHAFAEVQYEDLLRDPVKTLSEVAIYLGIDNHGDVLAAAMTRLRSQVRADNSLKWKQHLTWREVECFEAFAGDELQALGYPLQFRPRTGRRRAAESLFWQAQAICRRLGNRRYWSDNWYKLGLRFRDAALALRAFSRHRERDPWSTRGLRP